MSNLKYTGSKSTVKPSAASHVLGARSFGRVLIVLEILSTVSNALGAVHSLNKVIIKLHMHELSGRSAAESLGTGPDQDRA